MGIQSDVESLSIQALENYAKIHNLSENCIFHLSRVLPQLSVNGIETKVLK